MRRERDDQLVHGRRSCKPGVSGEEPARQAEAVGGIVRERVRTVDEDGGRPSEAQLTSVLVGADQQVLDALVVPPDQEQRLDQASISDAPVGAVVDVEE
jgi:hypothetical protein